MIKFSISFFFCFSVLFLDAQVDKKSYTYVKNQQDLNSSEILNYYINTYELKDVDSVMTYNAIRLKEADQKDFVMHELARVLHYKTTFRLDSALVLIDGIRDNSILINNNVLNASYETLYGIIGYDLNRPKIARTHYTSGFELYLKIKDSAGVKGNLINIGSTYFLEEKFDSAEIYFEKAQAYENLGIYKFHENLANNLATVYQNTNRYDKAIASYLRLIEEGNRTNSTHFYNLGVVYYKNKQYLSSVEMLETATTIEYDKSNIYLSSVYSALSRSLNQIGESGKAYIALSHSDSLKVLEDKESANRLLDELKLKHQEKLFEREKSLTEERIRHEQKENLLLLFILGLVTVVLIVIVILFIIKSKKNQVLFLKNIELTVSNQKPIKLKSDNPISLELITKLEKLLYDKEVFTNSKLTLEKLSKQLNTNRTYLSETINTHYNLSFSVLINRLRVKKAREMLIDNEFIHYSIEGVSTSVGFNSISTFNTYFKKETGITPSYFRKKSQETV
jgi:AraC-like DNA-binding protein